MSERPKINFGCYVEAGGICLPTAIIFIKTLLSGNGLLLSSELGCGAGLFIGILIALARHPDFVNDVLNQKN